MAAPIGSLAWLAWLAWLDLACLDRRGFISGLTSNAVVKCRLGIGGKGHGLRSLADNALRALLCALCFAISNLIVLSSQ